MRYLLLILLLSAASGLPSSAAPESTNDALSDRHASVGRGSDHGSMSGEMIDAAPHRRAKRLAGMGDVHLPITTRKPEAQAFFDQGIAQLHTYYYYESERSFREVARIDPECAMAYWGMAMANTNNDDRARAFLEKAEARRKALSEREQKYLDCLAARYKEGGSYEERQKAYVRAWEKILFAYPEEIEAKAFLAGALLAGDRSSHLAISALIEQILQKQPLHPGAHHYRIHLWDGHEPKQALASAQAYARAAPGIAHAWHMPGHIYNGLGRWREAAYQQEGSARVDHAHIAREGLLPFQIHNYAHNQQYLIANLNHLGRVQEAIANARNLIETPRDPKGNNATDAWSAQRMGRTSLMRIYVRYERWDDLLADPLLDWSDEPLEQAWKAYSRGLAHLGKGDREQAEQEAAALDKLVTTAAAAKPPTSGKELMEIARQELRGRLAVAEGKTLEGFTLLNKAVAQVEGRDRDLGGYPRPFHEVLGQVHLQARNWGLAEACFRKVLDDRPKTLVSLAGLVEACARGDRRDEAAAAWREFELACRDADPGLPLHARLRSLAPSGARSASAARLVDGPGPGPPAAPASMDPAAPGGTAASRDRESGESEPVAPVPLTGLGPSLWQPAAAPPFALPDSTGRRHSLADYRGQNLILVFYLGGGCEHCLKQLQALGKEVASLEKLGARVAAVSVDSPASSRKLMATPPGRDLPLLLSDPDRQVARLYGAWDEFEEVPLHATYLIDRAGNVRWYRVSTDPFRDLEFLKTELARVNLLTAGK